MNTPALASGGSLAYRARVRPVDVEGTAFEFGAYGTAHAARNPPDGGLPHPDLGPLTPPRTRPSPDRPPPAHWTATFPTGTS